MTNISIIASPMCWGNGAFVIHKELERALPAYRVLPYHPNWTCFPSACPWPSTLKGPSRPHHAGLCRLLMRQEHPLGGHFPQLRA